MNSEYYVSARVATGQGRGLLMYFVKLVKWSSLLQTNIQYSR